MSPTFPPASDDIGPTGPPVPCCGKPLAGAVDLGATKLGLLPGTICVCMNCAAPLAFTDRMELRPLSAFELALIEPSFRTSIEKAQRAARRIQSTTRLALIGAPVVFPAPGGGAPGGPPARPSIVLPNLLVFPCCGGELARPSAVSMHGRAKTTQPGDVTVCPFCAELLRFNPDLSLRRATPDELASVDEDSRRALALSRGIVRERLAQQHDDGLGT